MVACRLLPLLKGLVVIAFPWLNKLFPQDYLCHDTILCHTYSTSKVEPIAMPAFSGDASNPNRLLSEFSNISCMIMKKWNEPNGIQTGQAAENQRLLCSYLHRDLSLPGTFLLCKRFSFFFTKSKPLHKMTDPQCLPFLCCTKAINNLQFIVPSSVVQDKKSFDS